MTKDDEKTVKRRLKCPECLVEHCCCDQGVVLNLFITNFLSKLNFSSWIKIWIKTGQESIF